MARRAEGTVWVLALAAVAVGAGAVGRFPLHHAQDGLAFALLAAAGVAVLGLPLLVAEGALGQYRRRNVVDAFGPGAWRAAGWFALAACLALAALLSVVGGWAARLAYESFFAASFDDPGRTVRLATQGWDAMLWQLGVLATVMALGYARALRGLNGMLAATGLVLLVAVAALAGWGLLAAGADGRTDLVRVRGSSIDAALVVAAFQQALLPGLVGLGAVATLSAQGQDRRLPNSALLLAMAWVALALGAGFALAGLGAAEGVLLAADADGQGRFLAGAFALGAAIGHTAGGVLAGTYYGVLLAGCMAALLAVLEVPATWLHQRFPSWAPGRGQLGAGLASYLAGMPLCFVAGAAADVDLVLAAVVAPVGGLLVALHVGWARPEVLDGFQVTEARHALDRFLRPTLRYAVPPLLLLLLAVGVAEVLAATGAVSRGSGGLWPLVP